MISAVQEKSIDELNGCLHSWLKEKEHRLGLLTSIDGNQLVSVLLNQRDSSISIVMTPLNSNTYQSLTSNIPQTHWYERSIYDLFGVYPAGHPRLKPAVINESSKIDFAPLSDHNLNHNHRDLNYMHVAGEGIYELPVGPVHAGIIEPAHFRLSCLGESIVNLEIRLGFLHRGVEKRLTEVPWRKARFVAEAAASDTAAANALAHSIAIESVFRHEVSARTQYLRTLALEIERLAMHIGDVGGMAVDLGYLGVAAAGSRLRGSALYMADLLSGSRYLRGFILPGGVSRDPDKYLSEMSKTNKELRSKLKTLLGFFINNSSVYGRLRGTGYLLPSLAEEFGMVGVVARASNISYDARTVFPHGTYPKYAPPPAVNEHGDALARTLVRISEIWSSMDIIDSLLDNMPAGSIESRLPSVLPHDAIGVGIVEAFRGELIHLLFTDGSGKIKRYAIKDPSVNNWTGMAIVARNNVIADFPVCNKSFGLSYSGHDL